MREERKEGRGEGRGDHTSGVTATKPSLEVSNFEILTKSS